MTSPSLRFNQIASLYYHAGHSHDRYLHPSERDLLRVRLRLHQRPEVLLVMFLCPLRTGNLDALRGSTVRDAAQTAHGRQNLGHLGR